VSQKAKEGCLRLRSINRRPLVTRRAILREYPTLQALARPFYFRLANLAKLQKLFHLEIHDTEQIEPRNHNDGALFPNDLCETSSPNLVGARQNILYSINFLGTGGVADVIAASLSQMGRVPALFSWTVTTVLKAPVI
jgi:hypothetical protein